MKPSNEERVSIDKFDVEDFDSPLDHKRNEPIFFFTAAGGRGYVRWGGEDRDPPTALGRVVSDWDPLAEEPLT